MIKKLVLDGIWKLEKLDENDNVLDTYTANVPGCVHTDLKKAGIIKDIFYRDNAEGVQWVEECIWRYTKEFSLKEDVKNTKIVFEGLDVYCDIFVNGKKLAFCDDMFIKYEFSGDEFLHEGKNKIEVKFYPPAAMVKEPEKYRGAFTTERLQTRRIQCTYGWDWVQRFVTCGIYKSVYIYSDSEMVCDNAYVYTQTIDKYSAQISITAEFKNFAEGNLVKYEVIDPDGNIAFGKVAYCNSKNVKFTVDVKDPQLWSVGKSEQPIYKLRVVVEDNTYETCFGIRTVKIMKLKDEEGSPNFIKCKELQQTESGERDHSEEFYSFEIVLNAERVMCKGANWVPCEPFPSEESDEKITRILELAKKAGLNIVRVWGGGHAEKDHFYNECDRLGIFVIQDFFMACGTYPEEQPEFIEKLQAEAEHTVLRLRNHPSLVWWNADNENAEWGDETMPDHRGRRSAVFGLYPVVNTLDYNREIMASSPCGGIPYSAKTVGVTHNTNFLVHVFDYFDKTECNDYKDFFKEFSARFISEEFTFGAASEKSLEKFMSKEDIFETDDMWLYHSKNNPFLRDEILNFCNSFTKAVLGDYTDGADRLFKRQYIQYEWLRVSMELARRNRGFCNGIIYWMLNDCWPAAMGWSFIDYYSMPKASYYSFKKFAEDVIVSIDSNCGHPEIYLCNDTAEKVVKSINIDVVNLVSGESLRNETVELIADANSVNSIVIDNITIEDDVIVFAELDDYRTFYKNGGLKIRRCAPPKVEEVSKRHIVISADEYIHAVELCGDMVPDDNFFTLRKGEKRVVECDSTDKKFYINAYTLA